MDCLCGTLKGVWNFILGSIRLILFSLSFVFVLVQLVWLGVLLFTKDKFNAGLSESDLDYKVFLQVLVLISVGLLGCWATFFKNEQGLKMFAIVTTVCAIVLIILLTSMADSINKDENSYFEALRDYGKQYDWRKDGKADEASIKATKVWDSLQSGRCCGVRNASDWDLWRPNDIGKEYFPKTCCLAGTVDEDKGLCSTKDSFLMNIGCLKLVQLLEAFHFVIHIGFIFILIILTTLSWFYIFGHR